MQEEEIWLTGKVKFFNEKNQFGFIRVDQTGQEIYVHEKDCIDNISDEDLVSFTIGEATRGPVAQQVRKITPPA